jgi:hypothetical protein
MECRAPERGARKANCTEEDLCIGQEESAADRDVFTTMGADRQEHGDKNVMFDAGEVFRRATQRRRH